MTNLIIKLRLLHFFISCMLIDQLMLYKWIDTTSSTHRDNVTNCIFISCFHLRIHWKSWELYPQNWDFLDYFWSKCLMRNKESTLPGFIYLQFEALFCLLFVSVEYFCQTLLVWSDRSQSLLGQFSCYLIPHLPSLNNT